MNDRHSQKQIVCIWLAVCMLVLIGLACARVNNSLPANITATAGVAATQAAAAKTAEAVTQKAEQALRDTSTATARIARATHMAEVTATAHQAAVASGTAQLTATMAAIETRTGLERRGHTTETVAARRAQTHEAAAQKTAQTANFQKDIQRLYDDGIIVTTEGKYLRLDNFFASWAQMNYYQWQETHQFPTEFVIRVDASWNSASDIANWFNSGCGFVYSEKGVNNHRVAYLGLDGYVYVLKVRNGDLSLIGRSYYGQLDVPEGSAEMMLVVEGGRVTFFVNGYKTLREADSSYTEGELGLTLLSGTNKSYGTRCRMDNIDLWIIK